MLLLHAIIPCLHTIHFCGSVNSELRTAMLLLCIAVHKYIISTWFFIISRIVHGYIILVVHCAPLWSLQSCFLNFWHYHPYILEHFNEMFLHLYIHNYSRTICACTLHVPSHSAFLHYAANIYYACSHSLYMCVLIQTRPHSAVAASLYGVRFCDSSHSLVDVSYRHTPSLSSSSSSFSSLLCSCW